MNLRSMYDDSLDKANHPEGTWSTNTRNIVITKDKKAVSNENGFLIYASNYPEGNTPIGQIALRNDEFIVFSVNETSEIGLVNKHGVYSIIVKDNLGFNSDFPISGGYQTNIYGHIEIVFTDTIASLKLLNITKLPFELNPDFSLVDITQLNNALVFPDYNIPVIDVDRVNSVGGSIETGTIYFSGQYEDANGFLTNPFPISNPVLIIPKTDSNFWNISGAAPLTRTSNSVDITFSGLDNRFKKLHIIVVRKSNGQKYPERFRELTIKGSTLSTTYTGTEDVESISLAELLVDKASYTTAQGVLPADDNLYVYGPSSNVNLNIQKYVNGWSVKYATEEVQLNSLSDSYKDGKAFFTKKPFLHNEVYALFAGVVMKNGSYGGAFHISGRAAREIDGIPGALENQLISTMVAANPYLAEDVLINPDTRYYQTRDTSSADGTLGYWENQNEFYADSPEWDIWDVDGMVGTLRGQKVRHHKTPTIDKHGYYNTATGRATILGFKIENAYLPDEILEQIQHIEIFYAKRTGANSTLAGRSLLFLSSVASIDGSIVNASAAGNWDVERSFDNTPYHNIQTNPKYIRSHPFDMLLDKTNVLPTHIYNNKKFIADVYVEHSDPTASMHVSSDFTDSSHTDIVGVLEEHKVRSIYNQKYIPHNTVIDSDVNNRYSEEAFLAELRTKNTMGLDISLIKTGESTGWKDIFHNVYLSDLCIWKEDAYLGIETLELVSTGKVLENGDRELDNIFGGDGYYGTQGLLLSTSNENTQSDADEHDALWAKYKFYVETSNAPELQYGDFYPKNSNLIIVGETLNRQEFPIIYNKDYTSINDLNVITQFDFETEQINSFPNRILRAKKAQREEKVSSWRTFLANDYYETSRERGKITGMSYINGELLIQHEHGLYITRGKEQLQTDVSTIEVGSGDVFARPPEPVIDSQHGYIGCQSRFGYGKFKNGYWCIDEFQGKIFVMDNAMNEVSNQGMYNWLREHLQLGSINDNPFIANGITGAYDEVNNRLIFTKKYIDPDTDEDKSFTISFSMEINGWVALHDYTPDMIFSTANKLFSFKNNNIYVHNVPNKKGIYYDDTKHPAYIEMVNPSPQSILASNISWRSQFKLNGVINETETLTHIMLYNDTQCSGIVPITYRSTTRNAEGLWNFNNFRDLVKNKNLIFLDANGNVIESNIDATKPFFKKTRFIANYLCVRFIFDNLKQADFVLSDFALNARPSYR